MKGKSKEEARDELSKSGMSGESLEHILPHKLVKTLLQRRPCHDLLVNQCSRGKGKQKCLSIQKYVYKISCILINTTKCNWQFIINVKQIFQLFYDLPDLTGKEISDSYNKLTSETPGNGKVSCPPCIGFCVSTGIKKSHGINLVPGISNYRS
jgi:hypothetical protein